MRINEADIKHLRTNTDEGVKLLLDFYDFVTKDQDYESYVARVVTIDTWNNNLISAKVPIVSFVSTEISIDNEGISEKEIAKEEAKRDKEVDRVLKFLEKQPILLDGTREIRARLTGDDLEQLKKDKRLSVSKDLAF